MEKVLVTGGAGYVGSVLVPMMVEAGYNVRVLDKLMHANSYALSLTQAGGRSLLNHPNFDGLVVGDIRDERTVRDAVKGRDSIIHLAALVGEPACDKKYPELAPSVNVTGTQILLDARSRSQKFVYASSGSNYGKVESGRCIEGVTPLNPLSLYSRTKAAAEEGVLADGGVAYRLPTCFGLSPRFRRDLLLHTFADELVNRKHLAIFQPNMNRPFLHITDMARAYLFALENFGAMKGEAFNVSDEQSNRTKAQLAELVNNAIQEKFGYKGTVSAMEGFDPDCRDYVLDSAKISQIGKGFKPQVTIEEGVKELVVFFKNFKQPDLFGNF